MNKDQIEKLLLHDTQKITELLEAMQQIAKTLDVIQKIVSSLNSRLGEIEQNISKINPFVG